MPMGTEPSVAPPAGSRRASLSRRTLLQTTLATGMGWLSATPHAAAATKQGAASSRSALRVLTAWQQGETAYAGIWSPGVPLRGIALPARAHGLLPVPASAGLPGAQALVLARRPGEYLLRMDLHRQRALQWHPLEDDRYLAGHACASLDGTTFFTTETDGETGAGLVVERHWASLEKQREFASHGIGPHALLTLPDGHLLVANGGILNLPETGRHKLNIGRMAPNLSVLEPTTGERIQGGSLDDPYLSLRHLARSADGTVAVAMQAEHPDPAARQHAPALALWREGQLKTVDWDGGQAPPGWDGYAGDVCCAHGRFWISAPRAGWMASWSVRGDDQQLIRLAGVGALSGQGPGLFAAGEAAGLWLPADAATPIPHRLSTAWDNHAVVLPPTALRG